jgi:hypothetical protein
MHAELVDRVVRLALAKTMKRSSKTAPQLTSEKTSQLETNPKSPP